MLDPDPDEYECGSATLGSTDLIESGSNPDMDPKPRLPDSYFYISQYRIRNTGLLWTRWLLNAICSTSDGARRWGQVLPPLCRTFRTVQKKNSAPSNFNFLKKFGLKKNIIFVCVSWENFFDFPRIRENVRSALAAVVWSCHKGLSPTINFQAN